MILEDNWKNILTPCTQDCFITASELGMGTTAGSWALVGAKANRNCAIAQSLIDKGLIILGKTNMTVCAQAETSSEVNLQCGPDPLTCGKRVPA